MFNSRMISLQTTLCISIWGLCISRWGLALALAAMELTFPTAAHTVLCPACVSRAALILWLLLSSAGMAPRLVPQSEPLGGGQELGRSHSEAADPNWPEGYSLLYGVMLRNKIWKRDKGMWRRRGMSSHYESIGLPQKLRSYFSRSG